MDNLDIFSFSDGALMDASLSEADACSIQAGLWKLLAVRCARYTMDDSSSVPVETAQELLRSICFTLDLWLKKNGASPGILAHADLNELLRSGIRIIEEKLDVCRGLWNAARLTAPDIDNISYHDTLLGMGSFFRRYDYRFFAHQVPCDIDYQLCLPVPDTLLGVEYIGEYLQHILIENHFLRRFDKNTVISLLKCSCPDYRGLLINLYEPAAANALGLILIGADPFSLDVTAAYQASLAALLKPLSEEKLSSSLSSAAARLCRALDLSDAAAQDYLKQTAFELAPRVAAALPSGDLGGIFRSIAP